MNFNKRHLGNTLDMPHSRYAVNCSLYSYQVWSVYRIDRHDVHPMQDGSLATCLDAVLNNMNHPTYAEYPLVVSYIDNEAMWNYVLLNQVTKESMIEILLSVNF